MVCSWKRWVCSWWPSQDIFATPRRAKEGRLQGPAWQGEHLEALPGKICSVSMSCHIICRMRNVCLTPSKLERRGGATTALFMIRWVSITIYKRFSYLISIRSFSRASGGDLWNLQSRILYPLLPETAQKERGPLPEEDQHCWQQQLILGPVFSWFSSAVHWKSKRDDTMASLEVAIKCCHGRFLSVSDRFKRRCRFLSISSDGTKVSCLPATSQQAKEMFSLCSHSRQTLFHNSPTLPKLDGHQNAQNAQINMYFLDLAFSFPFCG